MLNKRIRPITVFRNWNHGGREAFSPKRVSSPQTVPAKKAKSDILSGVILSVQHVFTRLYLEVIKQKQTQQYFTKSSHIFVDVYFLIRICLSTIVKRGRGKNGWKGLMMVQLLHYASPGPYCVNQPSFGQYVPMFIYEFNVCLLNYFRIYRLSLD